VTGVERLRGLATFVAAEAPPWLADIAKATLADCEADERAERERQIAKYDKLTFEDDWSDDDDIPF
jgi:hypothetical protein